LGKVQFYLCHAPPINSQTEATCGASNQGNLGKAADKMGFIWRKKGSLVVRTSAVLERNGH